MPTKHVFADVLSLLTRTPHLNISELTYKTFSFANIIALGISQWRTQKIFQPHFAYALGTS